MVGVDFLVVVGAVVGAFLYLMCKLRENFDANAPQCSACHSDVASLSNAHTNSRMRAA